MVDSAAPRDTDKRAAYVLDDEAGIRAFVLHVLGNNGFDAHQFSTPAPMLEKLQSAPPELVILDLALGQSDAVEVMRQLAGLNYAGKVLLISGRDEGTLAEIQRIGERHGFAMLPSLRKPFRSKELAERLAAMSPAATAKPEPAQMSVAESTERPAIGLADALSNDWLELWYQPKIDLKTLSLCGAEALVRARHPEHGILPPAAFLPPGSDPLHQPLAKFVISRAMADWSRFAGEGVPLKLAINLPVSILQAAGFLNEIRTQLPADPRFPGLIVELTEDEIVKDAAWIHEVSTQLKLYNIHISIDDFGSAYSSLSRLLELPCAELKLDRSFVSSCSTDKLKHALCQTVVDLAHRVGSVAVCAEGVETVEDLRSLIGMGCDVAQGYFFAKPMPPDEFVHKARTIMSGEYAVHQSAGAALRRSGRDRRQIT